MRGLVLVALAALLVTPSVLAGDHVISGTIRTVDKAAQTVTVKTAGGTEHVAKITADTTVKGAKGTASGATAAANATAWAGEKSAQAATTGSQVTVHYTVDGGKKVAHGIAHVF